MTSFGVPRQVGLWYDRTVGRRIVVIFLFFFALFTLPLSAEEIVVAGANVWSGLTYRGFFRSGSYEEPGGQEFRFELLTEQLSAVEPDVAVLLEVNPLPRFASAVAERLEMDSIYYVRRGGYRIGAVGLPANLREGTVVLADEGLGLTDRGRTRLSGGFVGNVSSAQSGEVSHIVATEITVADRRVYLFAIKLFSSPLAGPASLSTLLQSYLAGEISGEDYRRRVDLAVTGAERRLNEARSAIAFINETAGADPAILVGSLAAPPTSPEISLFYEAGFIDSASRGGGVTWDPRRNSNIDSGINPYLPAESLRIDYIMVRGEGIRVRSSEIILDEPTYGVYPSDHYGIVTRIEVTPASE